MGHDGYVAALGLYVCTNAWRCAAMQGLVAFMVCREQWDNELASARLCGSDNDSDDKGVNLFATRKL